ncbi:hypothetical protein [Marinospirillum perlucidum]|uniref:hypothetical protein n=1 Tax=Marinospirillum perlucidum TaxID=1982602 RepID=UPI000DF1A866|nr:hypothetical protein [Marinospirillum perlucidum]
MVISSVDTSSNAWAKQKTGANPSIASRTLDTEASREGQPLHAENEGYIRIEEKKQDEQAQQGLKPLTDETFSASTSLNDEDDLQALNETTSPDFTLSLHGVSFEEPQVFLPETTRPPQKPADQRPELPFTFSFGMRRPLAVAVAMSHPLIGNSSPVSPAEAIQQTLDLAATNRLPYDKGEQITLVA